LKQSIFEKILTSIIAFGLVIWLGCSVARSVIYYDVVIRDVQKNQMIIRTDLNNQDLFRSTYHLSALAVYTDVSYSFCFAALVILMINVRKKIKKHGFLMMIFILFILFAPLEIFNIFQDIKLSTAIFFDNVRDFSAPVIQNYYNTKINSNFYNVLNGLSILVYFTIILLAIWQPLNRAELIKDEN
jgi:hypothetical protein